ncbi:carbon monoxide dehydrogenase subunit G [Verticiella sediminum]|uniref:Carbon monoxide dehydrogenase subunit G n=1 Tax=Verticiella sediminum TaxID=1247510 RepID=A0A556AKF3_9BURK|nr:carbon monoxide dehydrogenase subunit G [Verticiella sediminum]TSH93377.1 carbon monoxide dehydrogenase subunit G [Verticiella sediminum]
MLIEGSKTLAADRATVWRALNDADFLRATIPDCKALQATADDAYTATLVSAVGPVKASFDVGFRREVDTPMESYVLVGEGNGGMAGSAQGRIRIALSDIEGGTLLSYSAETRISGKIAQLGSRLIDSAARKFSERFFESVQRRLAAPAQSATAAAPAQAAAGTSPWVGASDAAPAASATHTWWLPVACGVGCFAGTVLAHLLF